jgi:hypothetical protein
LGYGNVEESIGFEHLSADDTKCYYFWFVSFNQLSKGRAGNTTCFL